MTPNPSLQICIEFVWDLNKIEKIEMETEYDSASCKQDLSCFLIWTSGDSMT